MKIALVADIHSNQFAFEAVLNQLETDDVDSVVFLGDYAFGGCGSVGVVDRLIGYKAHPYIAIKGNKEGYIKGIENGDNLHPVLPYIYNELGADRIAFLKSLPDEIQTEFSGVSFRICHNPDKVKMFIVKDRLRRNNNPPNYDVLNALADTMQEDVCIYGHYHLFMDEKVKDKRFICACSVGAPLNADSRAQYLVMNVDDGTVKIERRFAEYDRSQLIDDFESKGYFEKFDDWSMNTLISMATGCNYIGTQDLRKKV